MSFFDKVVVPLEVCISPELKHLYCTKFDFLVYEYLHYDFNLFLIYVTVYRLCSFFKRKKIMKLDALVYLIRVLNFFKIVQEERICFQYFQNLFSDTPSPNTLIHAQNGALGI